VNQAVLQDLDPEHVEVEICRADEVAQRRGLASELDEMWSYVGKKVEDVSQVLICDPCIGGEFSVGQKPLAWAKAGGHSAIRQQYRQTNVEDSVGERGRACA
jgi:hypothetical protein